MKTSSRTSVLILSFIATLVHGYKLPANLRTIYDKHKPGKCNNNLQGGFSPHEHSSDTSFCYCGDLDKAVYIHSQRNGGQFSDLDIDCDGANSGYGKCANDPSPQRRTAFKSIVKGYDVGISDLDANVHPFVVFGNEEGYPSFDPKTYGIKPLSVMAVVCNEQLHYGIWGDTNGGTLVGEASLALGNLCFPDENLSGNKGHGAFDVMYIAFKDSSAVPGQNGANWNAKNPKDFEDSIRKLGDKLVAKLK